MTPPTSTPTTSRDFGAYALGATLYMPAIHPQAPSIVAGHVPPIAPSIVLCLEDALNEDDVGRGLAALAAILRAPIGPNAPRTFVRPRSLAMANDLAGLEGIGRIAGLVAPKVVPETVEGWFAVAAAADLKIMPTMESATFFDPGTVVALREALDDHDRARIAAIRIGGNDLLSALALRRQPGLTAWEGPLGWVLSMTASILGAAGYPLAAPVYDIIPDIATLRREVDRDVAAGFVSKTAIHPAQVPHIQAAFRPSREELLQSRAILSNGARAVFQIGGVMCEPSTHRAWASRILAREDAFGEQNDTIAGDDVASA